MTRCPERARLLDAEPDELRVDAGSELARHLRSCPDCAAAAARITAAYRELDRTLEQRPFLDAAALVARAQAEEAGDTAGDAAHAGGREPAEPRSGGRPGPVRAWVPLLAAAAVAGLLLARGGEAPLAQGDPVISLAPPDVSVPAGSDYAVLPTDDPDITVVWIFQGEGR